MLNGDTDLNICMACGLPKPTQRAHIQAVQDGGGDDISNLHLLCHECHNISENMAKKEYWSWFWNIDTDLRLRNYIAERKDLILSGAYGFEIKKEFCKAAEERVFTNIQDRLFTN